MLQTRNVAQAEIDSFVDRQNLVDKLIQVRKYSDTCCICLEPYKYKCSNSNSNSGGGGSNTYEQSYEKGDIFANSDSDNDSKTNVSKTDSTGNRSSCCGGSDDVIRVLPNCHHELHVDCFDRWMDSFVTDPNKVQLLRNNEFSCPICRRGIFK